MFLYTRNYTFVLPFVRIKKKFMMEEFPLNNKIAEVEAQIRRNERALESVGSDREIEMLIPQELAAEKNQLAALEQQRRNLQATASTGQSSGTQVQGQGLITRSYWSINTIPIRILGDDQNGPHSCAIIIGRRTVVACAHSLGLLIDESKSNTKTETHYKYLEDYWIQPTFTRHVNGECSADNRIPIKLFKFHVGSDWALFVRADGELFAADEVATIDMTPLSFPLSLCGVGAGVFHCPVSQKSITRAQKFRVGCEIVYSPIQGQSSHHVKYEARHLCSGSSGGGVYLYGSSSVLGMHVEAIKEDEYDAEEEGKKVIADTDKRVRNKEYNYLPIGTSNTPPMKKLKSDGETIASLAGGNNGLGSAIIICKFPRLMHYIAELEK